NAQIRRSADANRAFLGVVSVENGLLQLGDFAPFGSRGNPLIYGEFGRGYEPLVFFNDARVDISWRDSGGQVRFDRPFYLPTRETSKAIDADRARLEFRAEGQGLLVVRTVESSRDSGTVWVNYTFEAAGTLDRVDISVFGTSRSRISNFDFTTDELTLGGELGFRDAVGGRVRIVDGATRLVGTLPMTNLQAELSEYRFEFAPTAGTFRSAFAVDVGYHVTAVPGPVVSYAAREIFDAHGVGYLLIDRTKVREMEWLTNDRNGYRIAYRNFALLTLIFAEVVFTFFRYTQTFGGSDGIQGLPDAFVLPGIAIDTPARKYYLVWAYLVLAYAVCRVLVTSHFGRVLVAIRENEDRARFLGYNVQKYKMVVCMISALLTGLAGAIYPIRAAFATPDLMLWTESGEFIISVMIGGLGTLVGPIIGGVFFTLLRDKVSSYVDWYFIVIGVVLIVIVLFLPKGLLGLRRALRFGRWRATA
ncbi:MAG: branched-chain amino acid ABC transporter permease, partial [candidate division NC10 bacterium]